MLRKKLFDTAKQENLPKKQDTELQNAELLDLSLQNCPAAEVSRYFPNFHQDLSNPMIDQLLEIQKKLNIELNKVNFLKPPVQYVYNPTEYASEPNELYYRKYCRTPKKLLFVGMNPGPFGMCQTGVPFGDTNWVKNWLQIEGNVSKPPVECPDRIISGFSCTRKEQSGDRLWKFVSDLCGTPDKFFENSFVHNYCPLAFMGPGGKNLTPAEIKDCKELELICDKFYWDVLNALQPEIIISIGRYIEKRTKLTLRSVNANIPVICLPHPSPRTVGNHNWPEKAQKFVEDNNLLQFFQ